jgi:hypothetical protein
MRRFVSPREQVKVGKLLQQAFARAQLRSSKSHQRAYEADENYYAHDPEPDRLVPVR